MSANQSKSGDLPVSACVNSLAMCARGLEDLYTVGGQLDLHSPVEIDFVNAAGETATLQLPTATHNFNTETGSVEPTVAFQAFVDACDHSGFGHGETTVMDKSIRNAMHIPAERISAIRGFDPEQLLPTIHDTLFLTESSIQARLLKVNVYLEGGFFVPHQDTPLSAQSIGSLVVALPSAHVGGHLTVMHRESPTNYPFDMPLAPSENPLDNDAMTGVYSILSTRDKPRLYTTVNSPIASDPAKVHKAAVLCGKPRQMLSYAAFYGDALHEISEVIEGVRITLSYQLLRGPPPPPFESVPLATAAASAASATTVFQQQVAAAGTKVSTTDVASAAKKSYAGLRVPELKTLLKSRSLKVSGNRDELIARLELEDRVPGSSQTRHAQARGTANQVLSNIPVTFMDRRSAAVKAIGFFQVLQRCLKSSKFLYGGGTIGFPCFHLYEKEEDVPADGFLHNNTTTEDLHLRGADALIAVAAARMGLGISVMCITRVDDAGGGDGVVHISDKLTTVGNAPQLTCYQMIEESFLDLGIDLTELPEDSEEIDETIWILPLPTLNNSVFDDDDFRPLPIAKVMSSIMTTGNVLEWLLLYKLNKKG